MINRRDFRGYTLSGINVVPSAITWVRQPIVLKRTNASIWSSGAVDAAQPITFSYARSLNTISFTGFFMEINFYSPNASNTSLPILTLTTETNIIPETYPFYYCENAHSCQGTMV